MHYVITGEMQVLKFWTLLFVSSLTWTVQITSVLPFAYGRKLHAKVVWVFSEKPFGT